MDTINQIQNGYKVVVAGGERQLIKNKGGLKILAVESVGGLKNPYGFYRYKNENLNSDEFNEVRKFFNVNRREMLRIPSKAL